MNPLLSAVEKFFFCGRILYVKRDDLIDPYLSGNKFRKLYSLYNAPSSRYKKIISYGGTQSNAMLSIAYLCHLKGWEFEYICKPIACHTKEQSAGNLYKALEFGMKCIELSHVAYEKRINELFFNLNEDTLLVPQGGADVMAKEGVGVLADEIKLWQKEENIENLHVITPSGSGTTALYLALALSCDVYTTPVVGSTEYLLQEMRVLESIPKNLHVISTKKKYHFAKPYQEFLEIYNELKHSGIVFDLLYAPKMWIALLENIDTIDGEILYVHSGGVYGNGTMQERYRHKGWLI